MRGGFGLQGNPDPLIGDGGGGSGARLIAVDVRKDGGGREASREFVGVFGVVVFRAGIRGLNGIRGTAIHDVKDLRDRGG